MFKATTVVKLPFNNPRLALVSYSTAYFGLFPADANQLHMRNSQHKAHAASNYPVSGLPMAKTAC